MDYAMRKPCSQCGCAEGRIDERGAQDCVFCVFCGAFQYNAPRTETGKAVRPVNTGKRTLKPKQRARILFRAGAKCEVCGRRPDKGELHVDHILPVAIGEDYGISRAELDDDENLMALCDACNLGKGAEPMPLRLAVAILRARISWRNTHE